MVPCAVICVYIPLVVVYKLLILSSAAPILSVIPVTASKAYPADDKALAIYESNVSSLLLIVLIAEVCVLIYPAKSWYT